MSTEPTPSKIVPSGWNREHWYFLGLVVLIEFVYLHFIYSSAQDVHAINLWSFAGTITSIILAVIAIIYGFVQTMTQQSSADRLTRQLDSLGRVAEKFQGASSQAEVQLAKLSQITDALPQIEQGVKSSKASVDAMRETLEQVIKAPPVATPDAGTIESKPAPVQSSVEAVDLFRRILAGAVFGPQLVIYAIFRLGERRLTTEEIVKNFVGPAVTTGPPPGQCSGGNHSQFNLARPCAWDGESLGCSETTRRR